MSAPALPHFDNTLGAAFIGGVVASILFGITNMQVWIYYQRFADKGYMKSLVGFLWGLDALHLALVLHALYFYLVTNFANPTAIAGPTWSISAHVIVTNVSDVLVRCVFARRIWILSGGNWFLTLGATFLALTVFVGGMAFGVKSFSYQLYSDYARISWVLYGSLGSAVAADLFIACSLCFLLNQIRTGFRKTDSLVNILIAYCINTGLLTSICAVCSLVTYALFPNNFIFIGFYFVLPKLYINSLLATFNARDGLREKAAGTLSIPMSPLSSRSAPATSTFVSTSTGKEQPPHLAVNMHTTTEMRVDKPYPEKKSGNVYGTHAQFFDEGQAHAL